MDDIRVPIYLVTGFLESGKTTFLDFTLQQDYFAIDGKTLLILCEEGEEEYDMDKLKLANTVVEVIEDEEGDETLQPVETEEELEAAWEVFEALYNEDACDGDCENCGEEDCEDRA